MIIVNINIMPLCQQICDFASSFLKSKKLLVRDKINFLLFISFFAKKETNQRKRLNCVNSLRPDYSGLRSNSTQLILKLINPAKRERALARKSAQAGVISCVRIRILPSVRTLRLVLDFFVTFCVKSKSK